MASLRSLSCPRLERASEPMTWLKALRSARSMVPSAHSATTQARTSTTSKSGFSTSGSGASGTAGSTSTGLSFISRSSHIFEKRASEFAKGGSSYEF